VSKSRASCKLPKLYPILDAGLLARLEIPPEIFARELYEAGIHFLQYRDKEANDDLVLRRSLLLRTIFPAGESCLILNDRASMFANTGFDGLHVGQEDLSPVEARRLAGADCYLGVSTHSEKQLIVASQGPADYIAVGPVFATSSKASPDPVVGLEGVRLARRLTGKPLVAIGGINRFNCASVIQAGADSVAVISDLLPGSGVTVLERVRQFQANLP
jgi:thiamine-phosphate pyrophosphorylase